MSFEGLLPAVITPGTASQYITSVGALLYLPYPEDSDPALDGSKVPSRLGSPADYNLLNITTPAYQITPLGDDVVTVPAVIQDGNIQPLSAGQQQTGASAPPAILGKVCMLHTVTSKCAECST